MEVVNQISDFLWTYVILIILVGCAVYFTVRTKGVQFRMIGEMFRLMAGKDVKKDKDRKDRIGSFQAFTISLASRIGTGNLAGVASAIAIGGPGAVFWMWIMALLGAATAFVEATLAQLFKLKGEDSFYGGPAFYMQYGLGKRWMGIIFSVLLILQFGLSNQMVQINTIASSLEVTFGVRQLISGIVLAIILFIIISGGIKRISKVSSIVVPFMALAFILLTLIVFIMNLDKVPAVFRLIFENAFGFRQVGGAMFGTMVLQGIKRGLFSNEAGEGSAPNAAAIAETSHPVKQGLIQSLGVYVDTIVVCTCTAFIILLSGLYDCGADGIVLTIKALESEIGAIGKYFITAAIFLFAFSTLIGNYYYGETGIKFISKSKAMVWIFRVLTVLVTVAGSMMSLQTAFSIVDIFMGLLTLTNLVALALLSDKVFKLLKHYRAQKKQGKEPQFHARDLPGVKGISCWD